MTCVPRLLRVCLAVVPILNRCTRRAFPRNQATQTRDDVDTIAMPLGGVPAPRSMDWSLGSSASMLRVMGRTFQPLEVVRKYASAISLPGMQAPTGRAPRTATMCRHPGAVAMSSDDQVVPLFLL